METNNIKQVKTGAKHAELRKDKKIFLINAALNFCR
jgi:hypothetical protein